MAISLLHKDLKNITIAHTLRGFGGGLVEVFVPFIMLQHGVPLTSVCLFYLLYAVCKLTVNFPAMQIINGRGARTGLFLARMTYIVYLLALFVATQFDMLWLIWIAPFALALTNSFQWNSEHLYLSRAITMSRRGKDLARMESISMFINLFAPFTAGALTLLLGTGWPLAAAIVLILASAYWVRQIDSEAGGHTKFDNLRYTLRRAPIRDLVGNFSFNFHTAVGVMLWPIYIALILPNAGEIGIAMTIGGLVAVLFVEIIGRRNDKRGTHKVLLEGSIATAIVHSIRPFATNIFSVTGVNILWLLGLRYQQNPWTSTYYAHLKRSGINYILSMEIVGDLAYVVLFGLLFILAISVPTTAMFTTLFILAAVVSLGCVIVRPARVSDEQ